MPMDAYRHDDRFVVNFEVPGVDPSSIELTVEKNVLTVSAERRWEPAEGDQVLVSERPQGSFSRQLFLGESLDADRIEANYDHGVLTVSIPVASRPSPAGWRSPTAAVAARPGSSTRLPRRPERGLSPCSRQPA
jgi:HSP20 family protein